MRRIAQMIPTLGVVIVVMFLISHILPANPALLALGEYATPEQIAEYSRRMGYDKPLHVQFYTYVLMLMRGDLGYSVVTHRPVILDLVEFLPATFDAADSCRNTWPTAWPTTSEGKSKRYSALV